MERLLFSLQGNPNPNELMCVLVWKLPPHLHNEPSSELSSAPLAAQSILPPQVNAVSSSIKGKPRGNGNKCGFGWSEQQVPVTRLPEQSNPACCAWRALLEPAVCMGPVSTPDPQEIGFGNSLQDFPELGNALGMAAIRRDTGPPLVGGGWSWENLQLKHGEFCLPVPTELFVPPHWADRMKPEVNKCNQSEEGSSCLWQRTLQGREEDRDDVRETGAFPPPSFLPNEFFPLA